MNSQQQLIIDKIIDNERKNMFLQSRVNQVILSAGNKKLFDKICEIENDKKIFYNSNIKINTKV